MWAKRENDTNERPTGTCSKLCKIWWIDGNCLGIRILQFTMDLDRFWANSIVQAIYFMILPFLESFVMIRQLLGPYESDLTIVFFKIFLFILVSNLDLGFRKNFAISVLFLFFLFIFVLIKKLPKLVLSQYDRISSIINNDCTP